MAAGESYLSRATRQGVTSQCAHGSPGCMLHYNLNIVCLAQAQWAGMVRRGLHSSAELLFILRSHGALGTGTGSRCESVGGGDGVGEMVREEERMWF